MPINVSRSITITGLSQYSNSADELRKALESVPAGAKYSINVSKGDRPWESDSITITFEWKGQ